MGGDEEEDNPNERWEVLEVDDNTSVGIHMDSLEEKKFVKAKMRRSSTGGIIVLF